MIAPFPYSHCGQVRYSEEAEGQCADLLDQLRPLLHQLLMDGVHNIWIIKPGALSRGRGIECMARLESIQDLLANPLQKKEGKWIVQKYIGGSGTDSGCSPYSPHSFTLSLLLHCLRAATADSQHKVRHPSVVPRGGL